MFRVLITDNFEKLSFKILSKEERLQFKNKLPIIKEKGDLIGKPLKPYFLREIKFSGKRVYYIVFSKNIVFVSISNKKFQKDEIEKIRRELNELKEKYDF